MSDTPETDAEEVIASPLEGDWWVLADFARKLERERDRARACLREAIQFRNTLLSGYDLQEWQEAAGTSTGQREPCP